MKHDSKEEKEAVLRQLSLLSTRNQNAVRQKSDSILYKGRLSNPLIAQQLKNNAV
ncbi:MAG: hypothetical protein ACJAYC_002701 [Halieaceae bacterium]|jgi:hypothetical protein